MDWHQWSRCCESFSFVNFVFIVNADLDKTYPISAPDAFGGSVLLRTISPHDKYFKISFYLDTRQARKAKDLMHMKRIQNRHWQQLGIKANKLRGNTHFRDRNGMC